MIWGVRLVGQWVLRREAMGFGDVKLLGAIGAFLAFLYWELRVNQHWAAVPAFVVGAASVSLYGVLGGNASTQEGRVPFDRSTVISTPANPFAVPIHPTTPTAGEGVNP